MLCLLSSLTMWNVRFRCFWQRQRMPAIRLMSRQIFYIRPESLEIENKGSMLFQENNTLVNWHRLEISLYQKHTPWHQEYSINKKTAPNSVNVILFPLKRECRGSRIDICENTTRHAFQDSKLFYRLTFQWNMGRTVLRLQQVLNLNAKYWLS